MNPRIFVGAAVAAVAAAVGFVAFGQGIISDAPGGGLIAPPGGPPPAILPLEVDLEELEVAEVGERAAYVDIGFTVSNPNQRSVILQLVKYQVFGEDGARIHAGQIGDRFEGFVEGSNFYTVLAGSSTTLSETIVLQNTGGAPGLWEDLAAGDLGGWRITGEGFFNLSSMTAGGENGFKFELRP